MDIGAQWSFEGEPPTLCLHFCFIQNPESCFNKHDGPSDRVTDHSAMDK